MNRWIEYVTEYDMRGCEEAASEAGFTVTGWYYITPSGGYQGPYEDEHLCEAAWKLEYDANPSDFDVREDYNSLGD